MWQRPREVQAAIGGNRFLTMKVERGGKETCVYQWRDMMAGGGAVAMPRGFVRVAPFGARKRARFSLVVDLAAEPLSARWWRGAATLGLLCASAGVLAPTFEPLSGATSERPSEASAREYRDIGVAPLASGGRSGGRMVASEPRAPHVHGLCQSMELARPDSATRG